MVLTELLKKELSNVWIASHFWKTKLTRQKINEVKTLAKNNFRTKKTSAHKYNKTDKHSKSGGIDSNTTIERLHRLKSKSESSKKQATEKNTQQSDQKNEEADEQKFTASLGISDIDLTALHSLHYENDRVHDYRIAVEDNRNQANELDITLQEENVEWQFAIGEKMKNEKVHPIFFFLNVKRKFKSETSHPINFQTLRNKQLDRKMMATLKSLLKMSRYR
ncbi:hypothetical protein RFI_24223 [Reticulomyxa filosa]|uniref:Uncharacterized protein n=1 Tax=Reticulomyxa filosa TaxID=46433 RepID=X6MGX6_RETFI|nr:hypothetical protein RFI_24223 [Reticulomyxa filosa]|eukprot:ETO13149.1 hypothetical protein RFI_24223 [Reticulomyxa filosa]